LNAVNWTLQFFDPLVALSTELWHILPASRQVVRNMLSQVATWLQMEEIKIQLSFLSKYGKDFWFPESTWSEEQDTIYDFPPGYKSSLMTYQCLHRIEQLLNFIHDPDLHTPMLASLSPEKKENCQKHFCMFYKAGLKVHKQYSRKWFQTPLLFGAVADPSNFREFSAAILLAYSSLKRSQGTQSLFSLCIKPAVLSIYKERSLQLLCLVAIVRRELLTSSQSEGLLNVWNIIDRDETVLSLFNLLQCSKAAAVEFFRKGNTSLCKWIQTCIFSAPHHNKSVEGSFNIADQILVTHENISPEKLESIQTFLQNNVSSTKQQFIKENGKERWRPTKEAIQNLVEGVMQTVPDEVAFQKAKKSLKGRKKGQVNSKEGLKISERERRYLEVFTRHKEVAPKRRKKVNLHSKASTLELKKVEKGSQKKKKQRAAEEMRSRNS